MIVVLVVILSDFRERKNVMVLEKRMDVYGVLVDLW
jgi:hypothetical protein